MRDWRIIITIVILLSASQIRAEEVLVWVDCVKEAKKSHPDLVSAWAKVSQAKADKEITRSAVMPQISGDGSEKTVKGTSTTNPKTTTYQYEVTGQQLLFDGFKTAYDLSGAERAIISSLYNYDVTSSNVRLRLRESFVDLLNAQELLKVTEEIELRRKQNVELVKLRYEGGREHKGSLLTAEADAAQATFEVTQAKRAISASQRRLTKELGRNLFSPVAAEGELIVKDTVRDMPELEKIAETNPLLRQLIAQREAAKFNVRSAYAEFVPQVYASGTMGNTNTRWFPDKNVWSAGMSVNVPIFDGGSKFANVSKAKAALSQLQADERSGRDGVILTLSDAWTALQDAIDKVGVQQKFVEATRERSRIAESEYSIGLLSFDNWIIIEDDYVRAKKDFLSAQTSALTSEAIWVQAKGGTLDYD